MEATSQPILSQIRAVGLSGLGAPVMVTAVLAMMMVPMPPMALDLLFTFNIALALVVLLVTVYSLRPLDFGVFPSVLLIATLLRLALNIASTRVVLLNGHDGTGAAGHVIEAFGEFVIGGNYTVGFVVFAILVVINFVVVTKGAGRVSEVSARFTLDAMPGKQMAIDADLNAGIIDQTTALQRRQEIAQESDFYGSMDGASKFVRGDAVAGILILAINMIGGLVIGVAQHDLDLSEAFRVYSLLTIGDGLVAQIPSLLLSTATAMIVTRVSKSQSMGDQITQQLFGSTKALAVTAGIVGLLGLIPGMPNLVFLTLASGAGYAAYYLSKKDKAKAAAEQEQADALPAPSQPAELSWEDIEPVDPLGLEVGYKLIPLVDEKQGGTLIGRIKGVRRKLSQQLGFLIPAVHIRDNLELNPTAYRITLSGVPVAQSEVFPERSLAIDPGTGVDQIPGLPGKDPAFGLDAHWIEATTVQRAKSLGYTVVDPATVMATHMSQVVQNHATDLLGYEETQKLLDRLAQRCPKLVEDLVPNTLPLGTVVQVLRNLLQENVPVSDIQAIAELLASGAIKSQDPDALTAIVRAGIGRSIVQSINGLQEEMELIVLDPELERILLGTVSDAAGGSGQALEPTLAETVQRTVHQATEGQLAMGKSAMLAVSPELRLWMARWLRPTIQGLNILAFDEIPDDKRIKVVASVGRQEAAA